MVSHVIEDTQYDFATCLELNIKAQIENQAQDESLNRQTSWCTVCKISINAQNAHHYEIVGFKNVKE